MSDQRTLDEAVATLAITDVLHRYARALDRMDKAMALSCWHEGGTDDHAPLFSGTARGFLDWLWPIHAAMEVTRHVVTNEIIEVRGDSAGCECYWTLALRIPHEGRRYDLLSQGRYVDRFERIRGVWAIRHRQSVSDWNRIEPVGLVAGESGAPVLIEPNNPDKSRPHRARDRSDYSYKVLIRDFGPEIT
jgi:SnoaL-like domain